MSGTLFVISAPSGAGKTSLVARCLSEMSEICVSVSHTTRQPRPGEVSGTNYHFVNEAEFTAMLKSEDFLESATVFGNYYGTSKKAVEQQLSSGTDVILEIDWQGAQQIRALFDDLVSIFILPPSIPILKDRLKGRGQDDDDVIDNRLAKASEEMSHYHEYDFIIINDDFEEASQALNAIILSCRLKQDPQARRHQSLLKNLL